MPDYWKIDKALLERICLIAKLKLTEEEKALYMKQLAQVLETFKQLDEVKADTEPSFQPYKLENVWREDVVVDTKWDPLSNSKKTENNYFKGPKIV
jgi:aspartyl-tRNA(Asn)/glutamyl-tRNA(Gln) amidotransferase subunit C